MYAIWLHSEGQNKLGRLVEGNFCYLLSCEIKVVRWAKESNLLCTGQHSHHLWQELLDGKVNAILLVSITLQQVVQLSDKMIC